MSLTSAENIAGTLAWLSGPAMDTGFVDGVYGALGELGPNDLQELAKTRFAQTQRAIVMLKHEPKKEGGK
jgi:hypothetical protein